MLNFAFVGFFHIRAEGFRGQLRDGLECMDEVALVAEADHYAYRGYFHVGRLQEYFGGVYPLGGQKIMRGRSHVFLELPDEIELCQYLQTVNYL